MISMLHNVIVRWDKFNVMKAWDISLPGFLYVQKYKSNTLPFIL